MLIITMGQECIWETLWREVSGTGTGEQKGYQGVRRMEVHSTYTYEDSIMKPTKYCLKLGGKEWKWEYNGGCELVQGILCTRMELSQ
jgi:hypothetical protein